jgi:anaerobic magnesium-protoporphyrin IX monomethyl ester cyclase
MKITILRVPTIIDVSAVTSPVCPPIGLAYLAPIVRKFDENYTVVDSVGEHPLIQTLDKKDGKGTFKILGLTIEETVKRVPSDSDLILVSIMFSQDFLYVRDLFFALREMHPDASIVAGGEHVTALPEFTMESCPPIDLCVMGEGESTLYHILSHFQKNNKLPQDADGTCVQVGPGEFRKNANNKKIRDLENIERPDWSRFPLENYLAGEHGFGVNRGRSMPIIASRGCPYKCTFCSNPLMWTTKWKSREPQNVIDEMKDHINSYRIENFDFYDLTAIVDRKWIVAFCKLLIAENLNITWQLPSGTRSEVIDREVASLLYKSGCRNLSYAPESGSPEILKRIKKRVNLQNMLLSMRGCVKEGLSVKMNLIGGFPYEKPWHLLQTLKFMVQAAVVGIDDASITQFTPYPGSELFDDLVKENKVTLDEEYFETLSYLSSMTHARSYSNHLSSRAIVLYKNFGTILFYIVNILLHPWRIFKIISNTYHGRENSRLEKTLNAYFARFRIQ